MSRAERMSAVGAVDGLSLVRQMRSHLRLGGVVVGVNRVRRLMRLMGSGAVQPPPRTSSPAAGHRVYPYLLGGVDVVEPDRAWCADITYIPVMSGFFYLVAVMDWATRRVLSWRLSNTMEVGFRLGALEDALRTGHRRSSTPTRVPSSPAWRSRSGCCRPGRGCRWTGADGSWTTSS